MSDYSEQIKFNDHWLEYLHLTNEYKYNWAVGAYRSSKSFFNTLAFAMYLENSNDMIHLVIASTVATAKAIIEDGNGFGLRYYFASKYQPNKKYKGQDAGYLKTKKGTKIIVYVGGSNKSSYYAFRGWSVGGIVMEEMNLLHENTINEAKGRILMAKDPKVFISHNPINKKHPIYKWLDELLEKDLVNYNRSTLFDNPALTDERRQEIINEFDPESIFYRQYILGEDVDAEGAIYNIRDYNILDDFDPDKYYDYITVCDQGESISASVFILAALRFDEDKKQTCVDILKRYYYKNEDKKNAEIKMFPDTANDYAKFILECQDLMKKYPSRCYIDVNIEFYRNVVNSFRNNNLDLNLIKYVNKDEIEQRIKSGLTLLYTGKLRFYKECKEIIEDFKNAVYDSEKIEKTGKFTRLKHYTSLGHLDGIDAVEYAFTHYKDKLYI